MFSSLRLARSRSQSVVSCAGRDRGGKESTVNGDALSSADRQADRLADRYGERNPDRHVYQVTPSGPSGPSGLQQPPQQQGLSSCPTSPLLSGKPPKTPRTVLTRRGSSKWGLDKSLCPSIGNLRERAAGGGVPRWDDDVIGDLGIRWGGGRSRRGSNASPSSDVCTCSKVTRVAVMREDGCLGITVRGGAPQPLVITSVHPGGPADREGSIRPGDRLLAVDGTNLQLADLSTAHAALRQGACKAQPAAQGRQGAATSVLTIEYSVCVVGSVVGAQGPLLVELARPPTHQLGLTLRTDRDHLGRTAVVVDDIKPASVADRSGALHRGDQILAVDDVRVDGTDRTSSDVVALLTGGRGGGGVLRLEILPAHCLHHGSPAPRFGHVHQRSPCTSESGLSAYNVSRTHRSYDNGSLASSTGGSATGSGLVSHTEVLTVVLRPQPASGYGLTIRACGPSRTPAISALLPDGPAERSGCLQTGDRILAVNDREIDAEQLALLLDNPGPPLSLRVSFSVAESVVPASGVFTVKLAKCRPGLGITITGNKTGEYLYISDIKSGSVAHRSGTLSVGDRLLEVDGLSLNSPSKGFNRDLGRTLDHAARILHNSGDVVTLKVLKEEVPSEIGSNWGVWGMSNSGGGWTSNWHRSVEYPLEAPDPVECSAYPTEYSVEYTVELVRHGGPLGLTIAGSEDPSDSVTISGLTPGGLAEQTGALHIGDRLLAINGESLRGRRLSEAISLFQNSTDVVTLKISRSRSSRQSQRPFNDCKSRPGPAGPQSAIPSVDSAVESWDSSPSQPNTSPGPPGGSPGGTAPRPCEVLVGGGETGPGAAPPPAHGPAHAAGAGAAASGTAAAGWAGTSAGRPLSRRAGSCPSLDCLLQTDGLNANPEWDGSLEDLDSAAVTAANLISSRAAAGSEAAGREAEAAAPTIPPPASFRQGQGLWPREREQEHGQHVGGQNHDRSAPWPRPPPSPSGGGRLTAARALNNDWQQRQRMQQQADVDAVDNLATSPKLSSFQWNESDSVLQQREGIFAPVKNSSLRNLDDFPEVNNNLLMTRDRSAAGVRAQDARRFLFEERFDLDPHLNDSATNRRASSLLLEEDAADAMRLPDLGLQEQMQLYQVTIFKDSVYEDFGFSVSDGLYERGVFINRIRKGGPADVTGVLQPYDRILQVNEIRTHDFDCCLTVPLIAAAGDRIQLVIARHQDTGYQLPLDDSYLKSSTVTQTI